MMNQNKYVAIMAGGVGSRFWPASTEDHPKQFLDILGVGKSLLQLTYERFLPLIASDHILIVTNQQYKTLIQNQLPDIPEKNILCEPSRNNTGPCVAYTALHLWARDPEAVFVSAPSDHTILKENLFLKKIDQAFDFVAQNDAIVTLGIRPTRPDTGYGYIHIEDNSSTVDICRVVEFKEKPDKPTAQSYLEDGNYLWNAGIFVWKASDLIKSFDQNAPDIIDILTQEIKKFNTPEEQAYIDEVYPQTPKISVDYAILEKAKNVYTIPADIGWSDLGTWKSLYGHLPKDIEKNVILGEKIYLSNVEKSIIWNRTKKSVVVKGLKGYIIVNEDDALLIYPLENEQEIKNILKNIK